MPSSILQDRVGEHLRIAFRGHEVQETVRPSWLVTEANTRLELDFFIPSLGIAFEVQGRQHYVFTPTFHRTYSEFEAQLDRDERKRTMCDIHNVTLFAIASESDLEQCLLDLEKLQSSPTEVEWTERLSYIFKCTRRKRRLLHEAFCSLKKYSVLMARHPNPRDGLILKHSRAVEEVALRQSLLLRSIVSRGAYFDAKRIGTN